MRTLRVTFPFLIVLISWEIGCRTIVKAEPDSEKATGTETGGDLSTDSIPMISDVGMPNDTGGDTDSGVEDGGLDECFGDPSRFEPTLNVEIDESWSSTGPYWKMVYLPIERMEVVESPPLHDGAAVPLLLEATLPSDCVRLTSTMIWSSWDYPRVVFLALRAWQLEQAECPEAPRKEKRIIAMQPTAGCWTAADPIGGAQLSFEVSRCEDVSEQCECNEDLIAGDIQEGEACELDCQCAGYGNMCLPISESQRVCGEPCSVDGDCWAGECRFELEGGPGICRSFTTDECTEDEDCEETEICLESYGIRFCRTDIEVHQTTRHPCTCNDDCETPGLVCILDNSAGGTGDGRCELPCETALSVCPGMHSCHDVITGTSAVCEWVGE